MQRNNIIKIIITIIILTIIIVIGSIYYKKYQVKKNKERLKNYINENYNQDSKITYSLFEENNILTKTIKLDDTINSNISISYNNKDNITGTLEIYGTNIYGNEGISYLKSTYINKKFKCQLISNDGFQARCDLLKKHSIEFEKEIKEIFNKSNTKPKYLK